MNEQPIEKIYALLQDFNTMMLITMDARAGCHFRPMAVAQVNRNPDVWLFASRDSAEVREIKADERIQVIGQNARMTCVVLSGTAQVVEDRSMIRKLWKPAVKLWFPDGAEEPDLVLIHITGERAEYWDSTGMNQTSLLYQSIKPLTKGKAPDIHKDS
jgi:general stress protein 26